MFFWNAISKLNPRSLAKKELLLREARFFFQRLSRGWDDRETWNIDVSWAEFILPRLQRYREVTISHPENMSLSEWLDIIDDMIDAFAIFASKDYYDMTPEQSAIIDKGVALFHKHYRDLWW